MTKRFLYWWLLFAIQIVLLAVIFWQGGLAFLLDNDFTYISFLTLAVWLVANLRLGILLYFNKSTTDTLWFAAESCMTLGMIGTVTGFIYMLSTSFVNIDPSDIDSMKSVIAQMAAGMGTALITTFVGLVTSLSLKIQIINAEAGEVE